MDNEVNLEGAILFADSNRGRYIPQFFAESVKRDLVTGIHDDDYAILEDPEDDEYWAVWDEVLSNAKVNHPDGTVYVLYMDGDLWLVPEAIAEQIANEE
jgi:hypothetical protein